MSDYEVRKTTISYEIDAPFCNACGERIDQWGGSSMLEGYARCSCAEWVGRVTSFAGSLIPDTLKKVQSSNQTAIKEVT